MKTKNKSGFTLIELMVVAIIVAILAAVSIPLMSSNKERAIATEAQTACGVILSACKTAYTLSGPGTYTLPNLVAAKAIRLTDLDGTYYANTDYSCSVNFTTNNIIADNQNITAKASAKGGIKVVLDPKTGAWSY